MTRPRIVTFSGSTRRPSRSRNLALAIATGASRHIDADIDSFDILDAGQGLLAFSRGELGREALRIVEAIEEADAVVAVTPVYKGSYTGLFKHLIDFIEPQALVNKPVVIGATGGGHRHALIVEHQLRPLFGFFSALIVPTSIYASDHEFADGQIAERGVLDRVDLAASQLANLLDHRHTHHADATPPREATVERLPSREPRLRAAAI
jgi:FMN reductase